MDDKQYERGFNDGYLISRFEPQQYKQLIAKGNPDLPYTKGMAAGHRASERELFLENLQKTRTLNEGLKPRPR